jgi:hypothetical protein
MRLVATFKGILKLQHSDKRCVGAIAFALVAFMAAKDKIFRNGFTTFANGLTMIYGGYPITQTPKICYLSWPTQLSSLQRYEAVEAKPAAIALRQEVTKAFYIGVLGSFLFWLWSLVAITPSLPLSHDG